MNYSSRPVQLALFSAIVEDPVGSLPEVKHAMEKLLVARWPSGKPRPVVVDNHLFESVTEAAHYLHYYKRAYGSLVKAQGVFPENRHKVINNLMSLIRARCDAMDYYWTSGDSGTPGPVIGNESWYWPTDDWIDISNTEELSSFDIIDFRGCKYSKRFK